MLQYQASGNALRKAALTVDQVARAVGAELLILKAAKGTPGRRAHERAEAEVEYAVQRIRPVTHVSSLGRADKASLVFVEDGETLEAALGCGAAAILLPPSLAARIMRQQPSGSALLVVERPRLQFARAAQLLRPTEQPRGVHSTVLIAPGSTIGLRVSIGAYVVIEAGVTIGAGTVIGSGAAIGAGVSIGADCRIHPRVVIYPGTSLGDRVVVQAGAVLGSDGFGYVRDEATGVYVQFPQEGALAIEDDVEIGANTTIDRGALDETRIGRGVKIDNLVHVGHNVQVGAHTVIAAQAGISGSSTIGAGAVLAGQVGIGDHATVGDGVILGGQGGVLPHKNLRGAGQLFWGTPAKPVKQHLRELASLTRLARRKTAGDPGREA